jgi:K+-transporting ATPase KdpC subunit
MIRMRKPDGDIMIRTIKTACFVFVFFTLLTGLVYPLLVTGIAQVLLPGPANGSLITAKDGSLAGSALIGQPFSSPKYFWGRLSATSDHPYNASASGGSNYSVLNTALTQQVQARLDALHAVDPTNTQPVPVDLVTESASGLDPDISPAAASYQAARVARQRGLSEEKVRTLIQQHIQMPLFNLIGEPRVNVLLLNLALDSLQ